MRSAQGWNKKEKKVFKPRRFASQTWVLRNRARKTERKEIMQGSEWKHCLRQKTHNTN